MRRFWLHITLLNVLLLVAIGLVAPDTYKPLAITRVDDIEIAGTADSTGEVIARAGVRLTAPTTGPVFLSGGASPDGLVTATTGSIFLDTSTAAIWQNDDGNNNWNRIQYATAFTSIAPGIVPASGGGTGNFLRADGTWAAPPGSATPSIGIAVAAPPAAVALQTEGSIDWLAFLGDYFSARPTPNTAATKVGGGGFLLNSFATRLGTTSAGHNNSSIAGVTYTGVASDNMGGGGFAATLYYTLFGTTSGQTNYGFSWTVPASTTARVMRVYLSVFNCTIQTNTRLTLSGTTQADSFVIGAVQTNRMMTITYTGGVTGDDLIVTTSCSNPSNGSIAIAAITIGT